MFDHLFCFLFRVMKRFSRFAADVHDIFLYFFGRVLNSLFNLMHRSMHGLLGFFQVAGHVFGCIFYFFLYIVARLAEHVADGFQKGHIHSTCLLYQK
ncbi:hypothetical protein B4113_1046 [Geobacillus sp. B4113_201601]|nr:hypothetical protein B4113_1046 [Geobacillus sp. B4113_201601]